MVVKKILFLILFCGITLLQAQDKLVVMGSAGNYYVIHKIMEKESLSGIGRLYGFTPRQLAQYNGLNANAGLQLGGQLKIQLTAENLGHGPEDDNSIPVYHIARKGDNLFRLSQQYFKVPVASMRTWNDLKTDIVKDGQAIIIGYVNGTAQSTAQRAVTREPFPVVKPLPGNTAKVQAAQPLPLPTARPAADSVATPLKNPNVMDAAVDGARELKGEMKPLSENELLLLAAAQEKARKEAEAAANAKNISTGSPIQAPTDEVRISEEDIAYTPKASDEGFFGAYYAGSAQSGTPYAGTGEAGVFKTLSGFNDRKFYVLMSSVLPGTIVRITATNKKTICARVLGALPVTRGAEGLLLRMSNAAAQALGMSAASFTINITYYQ